MFLDNSGNFYIGVLYCGFEIDEGGLVFGGYFEDSIFFKYIVWFFKLDSVGCYYFNCEEGLQFVDVEEIVVLLYSVSIYCVYLNLVFSGEVF